jgi:hypothetical protein
LQTYACINKQCQFNFKVCSHNRSLNDTSNLIIISSHRSLNDTIRTAKLENKHQLDQISAQRFHVTTSPNPGLSAGNLPI